MKRIHYLAAEIFFYSYDNYDGHLGINERFDRLMPEDARHLEEALDEKIDFDELKKRLEIDEDRTLELLARAKDARRIVDAPTPAAGFREAVLQVIEHSVKQGLDDPAALDALAGQICYRTADLSFLLKQNGESLEQYSEELRSINFLEA